MTSTDTWAIRIEAPGLEDVVTGPLTRTQADVLVGVYLDRDREEAIEDDGPTRRRITVEEYDPTDPDREPLIPEGAERTWWPGTILLTSMAIVLFYLAAHTYGLQFVTPRPKDAHIAVALAATGSLILFFGVVDVGNAIVGRLLRRRARSSRKRPAEVTP